MVIMEEIMKKEGMIIVNVKRMELMRGEEMLIMMDMLVAVGM